MKFLYTIGVFIKKWIRPISLSEYAKNEKVMEVARTCITFYYTIIPFLAFLFLIGNQEKKQNFDPILPLEWINLFSLDSLSVILILKSAFILVSIFGMFFYRHLVMRLLIFVVIFQIHALESSFGFINHQWYTWLYTSFIFIFLPNIWEEPSFEKNRKFLLSMWFAQAIVMLTYTMAGTHKLIAVYTQYIAGEVHGFNLMAFAYQSANWVNQLQEPALFAPFIINNPHIWWAPYVLFYFIQFFAIWAMVRTSLQKFWTFVFVLFHFGTFLAMGISFSQHLLLMLVLFVYTPFAIGKISLKTFMLDLPLIGQVIEMGILIKRKWWNSKKVLIKN